MGKETRIIYNVTVTVEREIQAKWLSWMLEVHLREMLSTGCFLGFRFSELHGPEESEPTYTVQYELASQEDFNHYERDFAPAMRERGREAFGKQALAFRTTMRVIAEGAISDQ